MLRVGNHWYCNEMICGTDMIMTGLGGIGEGRAPGGDVISLKLGCGNMYVYEREGGEGTSEGTG